MIHLSRSFYYVSLLAIEQAQWHNTHEPGLGLCGLIVQ